MEIHLYAPPKPPYTRTHKTLETQPPYMANCKLVQCPA